MTFHRGAVLIFFRLITKDRGASSTTWLAVSD